MTLKFGFLWLVLVVGLLVLPMVVLCLYGYLVFAWIYVFSGILWCGVVLWCFWFCGAFWFRVVWVLWDFWFLVLRWFYVVRCVLWV